MYKFKACVSSSDRFLNLFQLTLANEKGKSQLELPEVGTQQKGDSCATILFPTKQDMYMSEIFYDETGEEMTYEDSETGEIMELAGRIIGIKSYFDGQSNPYKLGQGYGTSHTEDLRLDSSEDGIEITSKILGFYGTTTNTAITSMGFILYDSMCEFETIDKVSP